MEKNKKIALLADVDNIKIDFDGFLQVIDEIEQYGEIIYGKLYGFSDRKHRAFVNYVAQKGLDTASVMRLKKRNKSQLDIRIIIDAVDLALTNEEIDCFAIITGEGDVVPLISTLKSKGKFVLGGFPGGEDNASVCHAEITIPAPAGTEATPKKEAPVEEAPVVENVQPVKTLEELQREFEAEEEMVEEEVTQEAPIEEAPAQTLTAEEQADIEEEVMFSDVFSGETVEADNTVPTEEAVGMFDGIASEEANDNTQELADENDRLLEEMQNMVAEENETEEDAFNISDYMITPEEEEIPGQEIDLGDEGNLATSLDDIKTMVYDFVGESKK